jgi:hypothetical protein
MAQPKMGHIACSQCNGRYNSERELRDHMQTAHRGFVPELGTVQHAGTQPDSLRNLFGTSKEEWAKLSVQLRNRVHVRFNPEELDAIDRFILLASQGSVFDDVCSRDSQSLLPEHHRNR